MKRIIESSCTLLGVFAFAACTMAPDEAENVGQARFALSTTVGDGTFHFLGALDVINAETGELAATVVSTESSPATVVLDLPGGFYHLDLVDADFGELLVGPETPSCTYSGPLADFVGCIMDPVSTVLVVPGITNEVAIPIRFRFGAESVDVLFSTGTLEASLVGSVEASACGDGCTSSESCASVDGVVGCYEHCDFDWDCSGGGRCALLADANGENLQTLCVGGYAPACAHAPCEAGAALSATCDPCVEDICAANPACCDDTWSDECVLAVSSVCGQSCEVETCEHNLCVFGERPDPSCDPCVAAVCAEDSFCCEVFWDPTCLGQAEELCGTTCDPPLNCTPSSCEPAE